MDLTPSLAIRGYDTARPATRPEPGGAGGLLGAAQDFARVLSEGEQTATAALSGKADAHALVQALSASQTAVETVVAVRDKVVEAYQEILRMPV
ncbi:MULTISPECIES: flagellar hook-basal body complex protein FliE [Haematobacter]|uniref:Flagellar hook-basal body protein FliE n=3 Tax=Haematobacter TaxID=366614 RepID=A0A086Y8D3_9RHOB|nr:MULTISPECIES: flagellar hook-basal body complex protein FliE [Haematobacter]KFI30533.1 flagellar hook-basal body protein FliE [Haematobacter massiliensis]OWJ73381.1 flagellar hook-basal body protein FliE [Haematobacter massiliensis]OWJ80682.1 flagellar hook-basal body protein FliE [Haematobacter genomosp. 1]OWJ82317.1 flagellar hook-basal body protein FliE [Haematobacter massiliensis]QBJ25002.1 flagellar hook-basal body complex protein FliE [Haematobacter massiliensis]